MTTEQATLMDAFLDELSDAYACEHQLASAV